MNSTENMEKRVAFVMVNHNGGEETLLSVESLLSDMDKNDTLFLVDNGTDDGSGILVSKKYPEIVFIQNEENYPFAKATNIGLQQAMDKGYAYVGLINPDVRIHKGMVKELVESFSKSEYDPIGAVSPIMFYDDPSDKIWFAGGAINWPLAWTSHIGNGKHTSNLKKYEGAVTYLTGCCWLCPAHVWDKVGLLDESYGMYSEDADWSVRAGRLGYKLVVIPGAKLIHRVSMSSGGGRTNFKLIYRTLSSRLFFKRFTPAYIRPAQVVLSFLFMLFYASFLFFANGPDAMKVYLKASRTKIKESIPWPPSPKIMMNS